MQRRHAIKKTILIAGSIALAPEILARALADPAPVLNRLPAERLTLLAELADTILPDTDTPGAKAAAVQEFIALAVEVCFPPAERERFWQGLADTETRCQALHGKTVAECTAGERVLLLQQLEAAAAEISPPAFFQILKELTLHGYFTSEIGATQALAYDPVPGVWIPDLPLDPDGKAWTPMF